MNNVIVVLLGHQAHVGKDMVGKFLVESDEFKHFAFANKLKQVVGDLYNFTDEQLYGDKKNEITDYTKDGSPSFHSDPSKYYTVREILQDFGQEQRKRFPDIWADYVCRQIVMRRNMVPFEHLFEKFVITDFRFPNEYEVCERYAEAYNWKVIPIKIIRPDDQRGTFAGSNNISETALNDFQKWHCVLENNSTKEDLFRKVRKVIDDYA